MFWIILILIIIIFLPFPIFTKMIYKNREFGVFLYKKKIHYKMFLHKKKVQVNIKDPVKDNKIKLSLVFYNNIISKMKNTRIKPILRLKLKVKCGIEDAAATALIYGALNFLLPLSFQVVKLFFNISKYEYYIQPDFNNTILDFEIKNIIIINLFTAIFLYFYVIKKVNYVNTKKT